MKKILASAAGLLLPLSLAAAQQPTPVPAGSPVTITVVPAAAAVPPVSINLGPRQASVTPQRYGFTHTGGGNIDVAQPSPDTVVITMTGVCVAGAHPCKDSMASMCFDLCQALEVSFDKPTVKKAKLTMEGRVIGLLRTHCKGGGSAAFNNACGNLGNAGASLITVCVPPGSAGSGQNVSLNAHEGPQSVPVAAGAYNLHQTFTISAAHPRGLCPSAKAASAEFAPDPALDPLWISYWEPFHGAAKKDFGFQLIIKVADDSDTPEPVKKPE